MTAIVASLVSVLGSGGLVAAATFLLDFAFRRWPTAKPLSILLLVASGLKQVIVALQALDTFIGKVIPQNVTTPQA